MSRAASVGWASPTRPRAEYWLGIRSRTEAGGAARDIGAAVGAAGRADPGRGGGDRADAAFIRASTRLCWTWPPAAGTGQIPSAAFIGPLDNLIWDRDLIRWLFDFDYTWEVYKPAEQRKYGHYVLPVLYGDRFIARVEPIFDRKARVLTLVNWWWEAGVVPDEAMVAALAECLAAFGRYLGAERSGSEAAIVGDRVLERIVAQLS